MKRAVRYLTDLVMTLLLLGLMAYSVTGQAVHEWLGLAAVALFALHHLLNGKWFRSLVRGRWTPLRVIQTALAALLAVSVLAQMVSGLAMSRYALPFLKLPLATSNARLIHLSCGYWSFLLVSLHLGFHWSTFLAIGRKLRSGQPLPSAGRILLRIAAGIVALYGAICFVQQKIVDYLLLRTEFVFFDYEKPPVLAFAELFAMMALWTLVGYLLQRLTIKNTRR